MDITLNEMKHTNIGFPFAGQATVTVNSTEIAQLGKVMAWGARGAQYLVRLTDGREFALRVTHQSSEVRKLITKRSKEMGHVNRGSSWGIAWASW